MKQCRTVMNAALQACDSMTFHVLVGTVEDDPYYPCQGAPLLFNSTLWFQHAETPAAETFFQFLFVTMTWRWNLEVILRPFVGKFHCIMTVIGFYGHCTGNHGDSKLFGVPLSCSFDSWRLGHVLRSQLKDQIYLVRIHGALHTHTYADVYWHQPWTLLITFDTLL